MVQVNTAHHWGMVQYLESIIMEQEFLSVKFQRLWPFSWQLIIESLFSFDMMVEDNRKHHLSMMSFVGKVLILWSQMSGHFSVVFL